MCLLETVLLLPQIQHIWSAFSALVPNQYLRLGIISLPIVYVFVHNRLLYLRIILVRDVRRQWNRARICIADSVETAKLWANTLRSYSRTRKLSTYYHVRLKSKGSIRLLRLYKGRSQAYCAANSSMFR